jgi:biopolymer transport protein TolR
MTRRSKRKRLIADINVVPYIDVMLVLLVIFMVTAPLLQQGVEVDLPQAQAKALSSEEPKPLVLTVDHNGRYYLNLTASPGRPLDADSVFKFAADRLRRNPQLPVMVRADKNVDYGTVVRAMVLLQQAGAAKVGLLTAVPEH